MMKSTDFVLKTNNIKPYVEKKLQFFIENLASRGYIEAVVLLGGLGNRDFMDVYSDIDIAIFYDRDTPPEYFLPFEFHVTIDGVRYEFNIHQLFYENEVGKKWDEGTKEAYSMAKVIVDKKGRVEDLIKNKVVFDEKEHYDRLIWIIQQYVWRGQIHSLRTYYRGYPMGAHDLLNECVDLLVEAVHIINKRYMGHKKWRMVALKTMEIVPVNFFDYLWEAMKVNDLSISDITRRISYLDKIYTEILEIAKGKYPEFPDDPYKYYYRKFYQLTENTFSQTIVEEYRDNLSDDDLEQLEGLLCLNLVFSRDEVDTFVERLYLSKS